MKYILLSILLFPFAASAELQDVIQKLNSQPYSTAVTDNDIIFAKYCIGNPNSNEIPRPRYDNPLVTNAGRLLSKTKTLADQILKSQSSNTESQHFYFYYPIVKMYRLNENKTPSWAPQDILPVGHNFLTLLCGEFRDRATMIEAKILWIQNLFVLEDSGQNPIDPKKNIWSQISAQSYYPYIRFTSDLWEARRASAPRTITVGSHTVDNPVQPMTVCETKYIFSEYIAKNIPFSNLESFNSGYAEYTTSCPPEDTIDYYDFRGDANFKHYSPEANAMIWYATGLASACKNTQTAKPNSVGYSNRDCENYFTRPFHYRFNAARATLAAWLFHHPQYKQNFSTYKSMVALYPHRQPDLAPWSFSFDVQSTEDIFSYDPRWLNLHSPWNRHDIGFNEWTRINTTQPKIDLAYEQLRNAVDRHTDWYSSGYNDKNGMIREQANSPFMATSYEMNESDSFTQCGYTVDCPNDGLKRWMFIFRVKPENWYTPARLAQQENVNFLTMWLDETSFGNSSLANGEKAWDRMGTCAEEELESILYLVHVK
ncbi:MAG: hypothetical protein H6623_08135 [Bdellovibrionaceae bacterium]|nr:hypothetical protein [Pseudobdellovibrionaceae bacterium]